MQLNQYNNPFFIRLVEEKGVIMVLICCMRAEHIYFLYIVLPFIYYLVAEVSSALWINVNRLFHVTFIQIYVPKEIFFMVLV